VHPVRQEILNQLKTQGQATVGELAAHLEMAPVSVRHHLDLLIGDNLVCTPRVRRRSGAGRPQQVYTLTPEAESYFPNNYRQLADGCLRALKKILSPTVMAEVMEQLAGETVAQAPEELAGLAGEQRLHAIVDFLNQQGYMAEWCQNADDVLTLHTCNCPYSELVATHPELCHMDQILITELTGATSERTTHIALGDTRCTYRLFLIDTPVSLPEHLIPTLPHGANT